MSIQAQSEKKVILIAPQSATGAAFTAETTGVDTAGWSHLTVRFISGTVGAAGISVMKVVSGTTTAGTGTDEYVFGGSGLVALPVDADDKQIWEVYIPLDGNCNRYWNAAATAGANACLLSCEAILSRGNAAPITDSARGLKASATLVK